MHRTFLSVEPSISFSGSHSYDSEKCTWVNRRSWPTEWLYFVQSLYVRAMIIWCNECQFLETLVAFWSTWTDKSHGHSTRVVRWLNAQQFIIRYRMPGQTVHVPHPLHNPMAQGNWPHLLARLLTILYLNKVSTQVETALRFISSISAIMSTRFTWLLIMQGKSCWM